jgi:hypothetical protein
MGRRVGGVIVAMALAAMAGIGLAAPASASSTWPGKIYDDHCQVTQTSSYYEAGYSYCEGYFVANSNNYTFAQKWLGYCPAYDSHVSIEVFYMQPPGYYGYPANTWWQTGFKVWQ